jgi:disulfide bond formation protein DsbB
MLAQIMNTPLIRCDAIQFSFLGISMAGWNAIISLGSAAVIGWLLARKGRPA